MQYDKRISDMRPGDEVEGFYLLRDACLLYTSPSPRDTT